MGLADLLDEVRQVPEYHRYGRVTGVSGRVTGAQLTHLPNLHSARPSM